MGLDGTIAMEKLDPNFKSKLVDCNSPLRLVAKMDRVSRLVTPKTDRAMVRRESIVNAKTLFSEVLSTLIEMNNKDETVLTQNLKNKLISFFDVLTEMSEMNIAEFDSTQLKDIITLSNILCAEVKIAIGRWYKERQFDNDDGSFDDVLHNIVTRCFMNAEFLGM